MVVWGYDLRLKQNRSQRLFIITLSYFRDMTRRNSSSSLEKSSAGWDSSGTKQTGPNLLSAGLVYMESHVIEGYVKLKYVEIEGKRPEEGEEGSASGEETWVHVYHRYVVKGNGEPGPWPKSSHALEQHLRLEGGMNATEIEKKFFRVQHDRSKSSIGLLSSSKQPEKQELVRFISFSSSVLLEALVKERRVLHGRLQLL